MMKSGVRILGVACAPAEKKKTLLIGIVSRRGYIEGVLSSIVSVDGTDSTKTIAQMLNNSKFRDQVRLVVLNGVGVAGLNILDIWKFEKITKTKVLSITRNRPRPALLIKALKAFSKAENKDVGERIALVEKLKVIETIKAKGFYAQTLLKKEDAVKFIPEAYEIIRISHLVARGVGSGESKGRI